MKMESLHKELDLIQAVISRMANNSFLLKGWLVSLVAVILALSKDSVLSNHVAHLILVMSFPVLVFWYLDAFYLHKEKCYRRLYEWVIMNRKKTNAHLYSLDYTRFEDDVDGILRIMFSKTLFSFYGLTAAILLSITVYNTVI